MVGLLSAITWRKRWAITISASARCATICRMLHLPGAGVKSSSSPNTPVSTTASTSGPRRNRSSSVGMSAIVSIVIGAAQIVAALFANQLAFPRRQARGTDRAVEHRFGYLPLTRRLRLGVAFFHDCPDYNAARRGLLFPTAAQRRI